MPCILLQPPAPTYSLYSAATAAEVRASLAKLSLPDLQALLPGMVRTGGDGLRLLKAEILRRRASRQVHAPACAKCLQRPQQCICPPVSQLAA